MIFVFISIQLNEQKRIKNFFDRRSFFLVIDFIKKFFVQKLIKYNKNIRKSIKNKKYFINKRNEIFFLKNKLKNK